MAARKKLTDAILQNEAHHKRVEQDIQADQAEKEARKAAIKARREANKSTAFGQLPAEDKAQYSELVQIVPDGRGYTAYQRIDALFGYFIEGSVRGAAKLVGMPEGTILSWAQQSWWKNAIVKIKELKQEDLDVKYTRLIDRTVVEIADRLDNGDEKIHAKTGKPVRVKVGAKDLMLIGAMAFDKRALIRRDPNTISEKVITVQDRNQILADQFKKVGHQGVKVLEGEFEEAETSNG